MVHALPLRLRSETIGAMNVFNANMSPLSSQDVNLAQALADAATIGILQERAVRHGVQLASQLQGALNSRIVVEQAKGIVAERLQVGMDEAFELIRGYARGETKVERSCSHDHFGLVDNERPVVEPGPAFAGPARPARRLSNLRSHDDDDMPGAWCANFMHRRPCFSSLTKPMSADQVVV